MITFQILNDNIGVVTFFVGFLAFYLYIKARKDNKRDAASLILQEIRYAEQQIRNSERGKRSYALSSKLLPTNSWNDNINLFIKDLKEAEIDLISKFYSQANFIDFLIAKRAGQKINQKFKDIKLKNSQGLTFTSLEKIPNPNEIITNGLLKNVSGAVEFLYNTPAVAKLRKISERKWYYFGL